MSDVWDKAKREQEKVTKDGLDAAVRDTLKYRGDIAKLRGALVKAKKALKPMISVRQNVVFRDIDEAQKVSAVIDDVLSETGDHDEH